MELSALIIKWIYFWFFTPWCQFYIYLTNGYSTIEVLFTLLRILFWWNHQILEKGELQVAGKERESQLSSQFRDIATIVMQKTINPETQHPYTITMIERLMHEIHFAVDPHSSSKKQVLFLVIRCFHLIFLMIDFINELYLGIFFIFFVEACFFDRYLEKLNIFTFFSITGTCHILQKFQLRHQWLH